MADSREAYILTTASGGKALRAFNAGTSRAVPGVHVLLPPSKVAIRGSVDPQRTEEFVFTSLVQHTQFQEMFDSKGWTVVVKANVGWSVGYASVEASYTSNKNGQAENQSDTKTKTVIVTQCSYVPMKSFQIPRSEMILTPEVVADALKVKTSGEAESFLAKYNSHIYSGLYHVGGVFMREKMVTSSEEVKRSVLTYQALKTLGVTVEGGYNAGVSKASGSVDAAGKVDSRSNTSENRNTSFMQTEEKVRVWGATTASTKKEFLEKLEEDPSGWAVIDNAIDQPKDMVGIWEVMSTDDDLKEPAKCICKCWQDLVKKPAETDDWLKELLTQSYAICPAAS